MANALLPDHGLPFQPQPVVRAGLGWWLRVLLLLVATLLLCNGAFLALRMAGALLPQGPIAAQVARGLDQGAVTTEDYPSLTMIGADQWTDCLAFELALTHERSLMRGALAPTVLNDPGAGARCQSVADDAAGRYHAEATFTYTRFWHGDATVLAFALQVVPVQTYRGLLLMMSYGAVAFAGLAAAFASRRILVTLLPLLAAGFVFSGLSRLGANLSHSPAFIAMWVLGGLALLRRDQLKVTGLLALALIFGAVEGFVDTMILCPLSAALAVIFAGLAASDRLRQVPVRDLVTFYLAVLAAWCLGFAGTYVIKLAATVALLGYDAVVPPFLQQLQFRMVVLDPAPRWDLSFLYDQIWRITYGDLLPRLTEALYAVTASAGWLLALGRLGWSARRGGAGRALAQGLGFITASLVLVVWFMTFREHAYHHAWFMVRVTIIWFAGGWCWFLAQSTGWDPRPRYSE